jgi:RNA methyltransferase, RsmE family
VSLPKIRLERCTPLDGGLWRLDDAQARHLLKALRNYEGAMVEGLLAEGSGTRSLLRLERAGDELLLRLVDEARAEPDPLAITLLIGLLKSDQFDAVLRASAELGLFRILPVVCARSVPRFGEKERRSGKLDRWRRILDEGTKVSGAVFPPELRPPVPFADIDWNALPERRYAALLIDAARPLAETAPPPGSLAFAVGPEGDWSDTEADALTANGFQPVSLGRRVLRASTAALIGCGWFRLAARV